MEQQTLDRNMRYLIYEIFWASIFTGCVSFNSAYIIRLGGSNFLLSLLSAGSALVNAIMTMPFAAVMERTNKRHYLLLLTISAVRLGHLVLIAVPWLPHWQAEATAIALLLTNFPVAFFNAGWLPVLAEVIPLHRRARIFAGRNITAGITVTITTFVLGYWLDIVHFPFNYQWLYAFGVVTSCLSTVYISRIVVPQIPHEENKPHLQFNMTLLRDIRRNHRPFANIVLNTLIFNLAVWMAAPLQPIYFVRELNASDGWLGLWLGLVNGGTVLGNVLWSQVINRKGPYWTLLRATILTSVYYFLIGLFPNLTIILIFSLMIGIINPGVDLSHINVLFEICPSERRPTYMGVYSTAINVGAFIAPLAVAPLTELIGAQMLMIVLGAMRLLGALLFIINPVHTHRPQSHLESGD